jgi:hypothetical protein
MTWPALVFWSLIVGAFWARPSTVLMLLLGSIPFASLTLIPLSLTGMTVLPRLMFAVVLILKVLGPHVVSMSAKLTTALRLRHLGFLALYFLVSITVTVIMPRLFAGSVVVLPLANAWETVYLGPIQQHFTQTGYVTLSVFTVFAVALMADEPRFAETLLKSILVGSAVCVATGLLDYAASRAGVQDWLSPFRNSQYAILNKAGAAGGYRRIIGLAPEASAYGEISVAFLSALALCVSLYPKGRQRVMATITLAALADLAFFTSSSTAHGGLAVLAVVFAVNLFRRMIVPSSVGRDWLMRELFTGLGLTIVLLGILVFYSDDFFDPFLRLIQESIFNKPNTGSYHERTHWNEVAWNTIGATMGLGVGLGSTRTSNVYVAIITNTGLLGSAFIGIFLIQTLCRRPNWRTPMLAELMPALKLSLLPEMAMLGVAAPAPDFGMWVAVVLGALAGTAMLRPANRFVGQTGVARAPNRLPRLESRPGRALARSVPPAAGARGGGT